MTGQTPIQTHLSSNATPTVSHKEILQFISLEGKLRKTKFFKVPSKIFSVLLFVIRPTNLYGALRKFASIHSDN